MPAPGLADFAVPIGQSGISARLLSAPFLPALAARAAASLAGGSRGPWRIGSTVLVVAHAHVTEALSRDLDFRVKPVNAARIHDVDDSFVLGMDRDATLVCERAALYGALAKVDMAPLRRTVAAEAEARVAGKTQIDVVGDFARPIAAHTAQAVFGVTGPDDETFQAVARSIFCHTFLNLGNDKKVRARAIVAAGLLQEWLDSEIARRRRINLFGDDMMGALMAAETLDDVGVRRTLAGMLVGSVDTTASAVAKIVRVIAEDRDLGAKVAADAGDLDRIRGWCWEALRCWPHNPILLRESHAETILAGVDIRAGDRVVLWTQAAMLDASAFPEPADLRPDRPHEAYLHFGGALHICAGRSINGWQIPMMVDALVRRGIASFDGLAWAGPFPDHLQLGLTP